MTSRTLRGFVALVGSALAVSAVYAEPPASAAFTYQGALQDNGSPASGTYDLTFKLYDALVAGAQIGATVTVNDIVVANGLITTQLDFGAAAFDGNARWVEIAVRPGASGGAYTTLTPRQALTVAPYALFALNDANWTRGTTTLTNASGTNFVGVNRSSRVTSAEYFGIQAAATGTNYGGMYIRTDEDTAKPFYGYKAGAAGSTAWTYLDGTSGDFRIYNGGDRLTVESTGQIGIGTIDPGAQLEVTAASGTVFRSTNSGTGYCAQFTVNGATDTANGIYAATYGGGYAGSFESHNTNATAALNCYKNQGLALRCWGTFSTAGTIPTDCVASIVGGTDSEATGGGFLVLGGINGANISMDNNEIMARNNGAVSTLYLNNDGGDVVIAPSGTAHVRVLEISGADVAERFPTTDKVEPGMVVMIDAANPGHLCLAKGAYNKRVAGIASGANGLPAGTILGNLPGMEDATPIALSGRVWVQCDTTDRAIEVGDMLTTSNTAGCAMAVEPTANAAGAIIGKAMTGLAKGEKGMVLVLVNLQ
ncbi:MAG: hypothetical protein JNG88_06010 [Phycisphaerales bacterium]|nr:hypothetical protein [Phycisphaerales bacterium]